MTPLIPEVSTVHIHFQDTHLLVSHFRDQRRMFYVVVSMGQWGQLPPICVLPPPPDGICPDHGRKPAFGNEAISSNDFSLKLRKSEKIYLNYLKISYVFLQFSRYRLNFLKFLETLSKISLTFYTNIFVKIYESFLKQFLRVYNNFTV